MNLTGFHNLFFEALKCHAPGIKKWIEAKHRFSTLVAATTVCGPAISEERSAHDLAAQIAAQLDSEIHGQDATVCYHVEELVAMLCDDRQNTNISVKLYIGEVR